MSFKLFDQGMTSQEVKQWKQTRKAEDRMEDHFRKWRESEQVLNMLRNIKASQEFFTQLEAEAWQRATKRR